MGTYQLKLQKPWEEVKEDLKETNIQLTDDDLQYQPGEEDQLLSRLEKKLNLSKQRVKELIESISSNEGKAS
ncbi:MAG TPA: general stress protein CsbD [Chitinophagaceae bacterium]|nr:general stress protein CsbD [Chitinophagaceae bacterium]